MFFFTYKWSIPLIIYFKDEITSVISLAILWMASHASPSSMDYIKTHGFYRLLIRYIVESNMIRLPFRFVNVNGQRHDAIPYDCFQMRSK